ncbi:hypothetical protein Pfo_004277 [Paulownia fortunei]|nr:hypothetical protein Pfo_004277 [Paulownia fortunei]
MMYVMSAGKAEISRLNCAMDETAKIVQELKAEISRRKSSCNVHSFVAGNEAETNKKNIEGCYGGPLFTKPGAKSKYKVKTFGPSLIEEGECASSVLMEEQRPEVLEMDHLEAELESELQKLPWCATESSGSEGRPDVFEASFAGILTKGHRPDDGQKSNLYQYDGVLPAELDQKLSHLLIEQQEGQIVELEAELQQAHSKLHEKEAELEALKNCVKRLSEFSLASASGMKNFPLFASNADIEDNEEDVKTRNGIEEKLGFEPTKSMVGMKRTVGYDSHLCSS